MAKKKINLFEAFAGIGSQHLALKQLGFDVNLVGISEWYTDALVAYGVAHLNLKPKSIDRDKTINFLKQYSLSRDSKKLLKTFTGFSDDYLSILEQVLTFFGIVDINYIKGNDLIDKNIDLFTYSFPCQDISQQGKRKGFAKNSDTRSGLLWQVDRILKEIYKIDKNKLPKVLVMENVKAILNKEFKDDLNLWMEELKKIGYFNTEPFIVNAKDVGSGQNRERVFMLSFLNKEVNNFKLVNNKDFKVIADIFQEDMYHKEFNLKPNYEIIKKCNTRNGIKKGQIIGYTNFNAETYVYYKNSLSPTITASGAQSRIKIFHNNKIIYLNSLEHLLLQGFNKCFYEKLKNIGLNDTKIKFLAGNSINVDVLKEIFKYYLIP